jgi:hypothetical protein
MPFQAALPRPSGPLCLSRSPRIPRPDRPPCKPTDPAKARRKPQLTTGHGRCRYGRAFALLFVSYRPFALYGSRRRARAAPAPCDAGLPAHSLGPWDDLTVVREALSAALKHSQNPDEWIPPRYKAGLAGFDNCIRSLEAATASAMGTAYNAAVWEECRRLGIAFRRRAGPPGRRYRGAVRPGHRALPDGSRPTQGRGRPLSLRASRRQHPGR